MLPEEPTDVPPNFKTLKCICL